MHVDIDRERMQAMPRMHRARQSGFLRDLAQRGLNGMLSFFDMATGLQPFAERLVSDDQDRCFPQHHCARCDVRWERFSAGQGQTLRERGDDGIENRNLGGHRPNVEDQLAERIGCTAQQRRCIGPVGRDREVRQVKHCFSNNRLPLRGITLGGNSAAMSGPFLASVRPTALGIRRGM